jgi:hypothetical protein
LDAAAVKMSKIGRKKVLALAYWGMLYYCLSPRERATAKGTAIWLCRGGFGGSAGWLNRKDLPLANAGPDVII